MKKCCEETFEFFLIWTCNKLQVCRIWGYLMWRRSKGTSEWRAMIRFLGYQNQQNVHYLVSKVCGWHKCSRSTTFMHWEISCLDSRICKNTLWLASKACGWRKCSRSAIFMYWEIPWEILSTQPPTAPRRSSASRQLYARCWAGSGVLISFYGVFSICFVMIVIGLFYVVLQVAIDWYWQNSWYISGD